MRSLCVMNRLRSGFFDLCCELLRRLQQVLGQSVNELGTLSTACFCFDYKSSDSLAAVAEEVVMAGLLVVWMDGCFCFCFCWFLQLALLS